MKIIFIGPLPPPITGQTTANAIALAGLRARGHSIVTCDLGRGAKIEEASKQGSWSLSKIRSFVFPLWQACKTVVSRDADLIYLNPGLSFLGFSKYLPILILAKLFKIPVLAHLHGGHFPAMFNGLSFAPKMIVKTALKCISEVIVLGQTLKTSFDALGLPVKTSICANGIENYLLLSEKEKTEKIKTRENRTSTRILFLSNLLREKGILDFLDAMQILHKQGLSVKCDIAGAMNKDIEEEVLLKLSELGSHAQFHGTVMGLRKKNLLMKADIFCLPTYYPIEGQPISILEAYGSGCAVVTTNHAGIRDIFEDEKNGFYCLPQNPESVADAIEKASKLLAEILSNNINICKNHYNQDSFVDRLEAILLRVQEESPNTSLKSKKSFLLKNPKLK